jgi:hypothetical protein
VTRSSRVYPPRVLDASALLTLFDGNPAVMRLLDDAEFGEVFLLMPAVAIAETESVIRAGARLWEPFLLFPGVRGLELTEHTAIESGRLMHRAPLMVAQVVYEAQAMNAVVVTRIPQAYAEHNIAVMTV